jgi:hypothetical protein
LKNIEKLEQYLSEEFIKYEDLVIERKEWMILYMDGNRNKRKMSQTTIKCALLVI